MSSVAEHLCMIELYKALGSDGGVQIEVALLFEKHHFKDLLNLIDESEMAAARTSISESLKKNHPERADEFIAEWMAWRAEREAA